jgi:predicted dehydrogenase
VYTVVVAGMGKRGTQHAGAFQKNGRFRLVGLCDIDAGRLETAAKKFGLRETQAVEAPPLGPKSET